MNFDQIGVNASHIKRLAKKLSKNSRLPHHEALDLAAQQCGFFNWENAVNVFKHSNTTHIKGKIMSKPLWITYAWKDNTDRNFDYLSKELTDAGIPVEYDRMALIPGLPLWKQIGEKISSERLAGWAYLITPNSLASEPCMEELDYALNQALKIKGRAFPMIGLLHGVQVSHLPQALQIRLCVSLRSTDWIEQIRVGIERRAPVPSAVPASPFKVNVISNYLGRDGITAIEVSSRFEEIPYWRMAFPANGPQPSSHGVGPVGGRGVNAISNTVMKGSVNLGGVDMAFIGQGDPITPANSAYAIFKGDIPEKIAFSQANEPFEVPKKWAVILE